MEKDVKVKEEETSFLWAKNNNKKTTKGCYGKNVSPRTDG
jgi:hypothetical protein